MSDLTNSQMLGEVQPGDTLQGPITLANIQASLDAQKKRNMYWSICQGVATVIGVYMLVKRGK